MNDRELIEQLNKASEGLLWQSESDYPFQTVLLKNVDDIRSKLLELTDSSLDTTIEERELEQFFAGVTEKKTGITMKK
ncbi:MAG: hypothetical protein Tsb0014_05820 [Pleurocapsa sp.]